MDILLEGGATVTSLWNSGMCRSRVRFHLGAGKYYRHWQIRSNDGVRFVDPATQWLLLRGCILRNRHREAERIYQGSAKRVCAWVDCQSVEIFPASQTLLTSQGWAQISFNPRLHPCWVNEQLHRIDGEAFDCIVSRDRYLYTPAPTMRHAGLSKGHERQREDMPT